MNSEIVIGIDIGGSHISCSGFRLNNLEMITDTQFAGVINNMEKKDPILKEWAKIINKCISACGVKDMAKLGFAMPGPFDYELGIAKFKNNEKYESLYNISIKEELPKYIDASKVEMRFINDATAFGVGATSTGKAKNYNKVIALTLGTGFGAAFLKNGIPQTTGTNVPIAGLLWDKPFKTSIADNYLSTRWCTQKYEELSGEKVKGVKEIVNNNNEWSKRVFHEFGTNMGQFLLPYLERYGPDAMILGGNISKANEFFLPHLIDELKKKGIHTVVEISEHMENAALFGACKLFDTCFFSIWSE